MPDVYRKDLFVVVSGHEFIRDGMLDFGDGHKDGEYKTIGHISFVQPTVFYRTSNINLAKAVYSRTFVVRKPEIPGYDEMLRDNQRHFLTEIKPVFIDYARDFTYVDGHVWDVSDTLKHTTLPHVKKGLRMGGAIFAITTCMFLTSIWRSHITEGLLKKLEPAKSGKVCRVIYNLGVLRCIQYCWAAEAVKNYLADNPLLIDGSHCTFIKSPSFSKLQFAFEEMRRESYHDYEVRFIVHSDDSMLYVSFIDPVTKKRCTHVFNVDISKCDSSYTNEMFEMIRDMFQHAFLEPVMQVLIDQLYGKIKFTDINDPRRKVVIELLTRVLLSGSVLTTVANTLLNMVVFASIMKHKPKTCEEFNDAILACGVIVTGIEMDKDYFINYQGQQFLKNSPVEMLDGTRIPVPNLGPLFRNFGIKVGDFIGPSKIPVHLRAEAHFGSVIQGMYPHIHCPFLTALRRRYSYRLSEDVQRKVDRYNFDPHKNIVDTDKTFFLTDEQFFSRYIYLSIPLYGILVGKDDIDELRTFITTSPPNSRILTRLSATVLQADYELGTC